MLFQTCQTTEARDLEGRLLVSYFSYIWIYFLKASLTPFHSKDLIPTLNTELIQLLITNSTAGDPPSIFVVSLQWTWIGAVMIGVCDRRGSDAYD